MSKGIDANELRIGNYLTDLFGETFEVDGIETYGVFNSKIGDIPLDGCVPIPLTEEWLLKFGFQEIDKSIYRLEDVLTYGRITFFANQGMLCELGQSSGYKLGEPDIKHVHQLQNLYFSLTGEELTFKLEDNE